MELGRFQMSEVKNWAGLTTANHLGAAFGMKPQLLTKIMTKILAASGVNNLETVLSRYPVKRVDNDDDYTWKLIGADDRNIPLLFAYVSTPSSPVVTGDTGVGADGSIIYLVFAEKYFSDVNVIVGEKNEVYQLRVIDEPTRGAEGWHYKTQLMGFNASGMPGSELVAGKRFSKEFSPVEDTMSVKGGDIHFSSPIEMRNSFTTLRMEHKVPGNMSLDRGVMTEIEGQDGAGNLKTFTTWMQYVEWQFERQWSQEKARALMFSRSNRGTDGSYYDIGKSGFYIKQGAGIREQMEVSNTEYYNTFSLELLESLLNDLVEGKTDLNEREFLIRTGTRGATQFSRAITEIGKGWYQLWPGNNPATIKQVKSPLHENAFTAGFQFTEYLAPNGIKVKLEVDSMYDDKTRNKIPHTKGGVAESYRYDILYMGGHASSSEPNIQRVETSKGEYRGYLHGFRNAFTGEINSSNMGTMEDSATYVRYGSIGAAVLDPGKTATLLPTELM
jgi:hypothetical protein